MADSGDLDNYLTMGESPDEASIRRTMAKQGPSSVNMVVYRALSKLRRYRDSLENVQNPLGVSIAMMGVKQVFERTCYLLIEIIKSSLQGGSAVGEQLLALMEQRDAGVRALATILTGLPGISFDSIVTALQKRFVEDEEMVKF